MVGLIEKAKFNKKIARLTAQTWGRPRSNREN